ncbi:MAG TPA: YfcE family phosphodiesterase [Desulfobulbaceae bacterium]|nr:YfcE family phosphodiesterase [Desulfobulbaceae bacterium]
MTTIKAGVLSDTHLYRADDAFIRLASQCFAECEVIIHAGDLTSIEVLDAFAGKQVYAVHGNMCDANSFLSLPSETSFPLGRFTIGLTHGAGLGRDIELQLWTLFPETDCMIFGHTHHPVCHRQGGVLFINPGTFRSTGPHGAPGTYAILEADTELRAAIHLVPAGS